MTIWMIAEHAPVLSELLTAASRFDAAAEMTAFIGGDAAEAQKAATCGATTIISIPREPDTLWESCASSLMAMEATARPSLILLESTKRCRDLAAQLAGLLNAPCFSDCHNLRRDGDAVIVERMIYGGLAVSTLRAETPLVIATVGAKIFEAAPTSAAKPVTVLKTSPGLAKVLSRQPKIVDGPNLADAARVVSVGRGFATKDELALAEDFADAIGGVTACSRPIAEFFKWMPEERYVGISGQTVKPQVYFACGISGQSQHMFGIRDSKSIVAINKDENAPIMDAADYIIVGDVKDALPALAKAFRKA